MDWTPLIGRRAPVELEALRLMVLVHQLGEPTSSPGFRSVLRGEPHLQTVHHMVRHPGTLALLMTASFRAQPDPAQQQRAAEDVRRVFAANFPPGEDSSRFTRLQPMEPFTWVSFDDALAFLGCRDLLAVRTSSAPVSSSYWLTDNGASHLRAQSIRDDPALQRFRTSCRGLRELGMPPDPSSRRESSGARPWLPADLEHLADSLRVFCHDEQIEVDNDLLGRFFQSTFGEPL